jgi:hypothetical protein
MSLYVYPKPKNLIRQPSTYSQEDTYKEILPYGNNDNFPLRLARLVQQSPTAAACIDTKADFIVGDGFSDSSLENLKVNAQGERFGDIHYKNGQAFAMFEGFAMLIKYSAAATITEVYNIPFEYCRLTKPDDKGNIAKIKVNPYFGTSEYKKTFTTEYDVYNPDPKVVLKQQERDGKKYKGQLLYFGTTSPLSRFYPSPNYYSCENWMAIDEAIAGFHKHNIENGFFQSVKMTIIGDENAPSTHPDDQVWNKEQQIYEPNPQRTNAWRFNQEMQKFTGWEKAGNLMVLWARMKEEAPSIEPFPSTTNSELFKTIQDLATEQIARATKVPSVLANIQSGASLGGDGNIIRTSVKLMQQRSSKIIAQFERIYADILSHSELFKGGVKILNHNPFPEMEKLDPLIWETLPLESKLAWIKKNTDFEIPDTQPAQPVNKFQGVFYATYPAEAKSNAKRAQGFRDATSSNCGGKAGWQMCQDIIDGKPLSFKTIKRIHNYLSKNEPNQNKIFSESCEAVLFHAWGGKEMLKWTQQIITNTNE